MSGEPRSPQICVGGIAIDDDRILLVKRGRSPGEGQWSVPGGRVEPGEMLAEAVVREVAEETGLEAVCGEMVGLVEGISEQHHFVIVDFRVTVLEGSDPHAGDDAVEARWISLYDLCDLPLVDGLAEFLHEHGLLDVIT